MVLLHHIECKYHIWDLHHCCWWWFCAQWDWASWPWDLEMKVKTTPTETKIIIVNNDIPRSLPIFSLLALACWCPLDDRGVLQKCFVISSSDNPKRCSVCDPAKTFLTSKFSYLLFCNPTHKTKTGIPNRWKTTNSKWPEWINSHQCTSWPFCPLDGLRFFIQRRMGLITVDFFLLLTTVLFFFFFVLGRFSWTWPHT